MTEVSYGKRAVKGDQISYGPFEDVKPFDDGGQLRVHYVSRSHLADFVLVSGRWWGGLLAACLKRLPSRRYTKRKSKRDSVVQGFYSGVPDTGDRKRASRCCCVLVRVQYGTPTSDVSVLHTKGNLLLIPSARLHQYTQR